MGERKQKTENFFFHFWEYCWAWFIDFLLNMPKDHFYNTSNDRKWYELWGSDCSTITNGLNVWSNLHENQQTTRETFLAVIVVYCNKFKFSDFHSMRIHIAFILVWWSSPERIVWWLAFGVWYTKTQQIT